MNAFNCQFIEKDAQNTLPKITEDIVKIIPYIACPFCKEDEFDLSGLKYHLLNYCKNFAETKDI